MDPLAQAASADAEQRFQEAVGQYQTANRDALDVYRQLSALSPEDSSALIRWAQAAEGAGEIDDRADGLRALREALPDRPARRRRTPEDQGPQVQQIAQQAAGGAQG